MDKASSLFLRLREKSIIAINIVTLRVTPKESKQNSFVLSFRRTSSRLGPWRPTNDIYRGLSRPWWFESEMNLKYVYSELVSIVHILLQTMPRWLQFSKILARFSRALPNRDLRWKTKIRREEGYSGERSNLRAGSVISANPLSPPLRRREPARSFHLR